MCQINNSSTPFDQREGGKCARPGFHPCGIVATVLAVWGVMAAGGTTTVHAQDPDWLIAPHVAAGIATHGHPVPSGGFGVTVAWRGAPQLSYQNAGFGRNCKTSLPPICNLDVSGARLLMAGWSVPVYRRGAAVLRLRPEAGIGWWRSNDESRWTREAVLGGAVDTAIRVGPAGTLLMGLHARRSSSATLLGGSIGLGIGF